MHHWVIEIVQSKKKFYTSNIPGNSLSYPVYLYVFTAIYKVKPRGWGDDKS